VGLSKCGDFSDKGRRGQFFVFCADVFYGRPLTKITVLLQKNSWVNPVSDFSEAKTLSNMTFIQIYRVDSGLLNYAKRIPHASRGSNS